MKNENLADALIFGHTIMTRLGSIPVVSHSCLLTLLAFNELFEGDQEADFMIDGDKMDKAKILTSEAHVVWKDYNLYPGQQTIFYMTAPNGTRISFQPYFIRGDNVYANIVNDETFVWDKKHFETLQTKTFKGTQFNIPHDPIGYLEEYYGKPWDDFDGRKGWHWKQAKNLQHLNKLP